MSALPFPSEPQHWNASLEGKHCLITGGTRGLGLRIAQRLTAAGAQVALTYHTNRDGAETAKKSLEALGGAPLLFEGHVADANHVQATLGALSKHWGKLDVLVNSVGPTQILPLALLDEEDWDAVMNTNLKGAFLFCRAALRLMIKAREGSVINIGNFGSERVIEAPIHYAAAKSALRGMTEALAREVGRYNVRVNLLAPGLMEEGLSQLLPQHRLDEYLGQCPAGRLARVDEIADFAVFLCSRHSAFVTGAKLVVDGGL